MEESQSPPLVSRLANVFWLQYNVILFCGAFLFSVALQSWLPVIGGLAAELAWLSTGLGVRPVYAWVERRRTEMRRARSGPYAAALEKLPPEYAARFDALSRAADRIRRTKLDMLGVSAAELWTTLDNLELVKQSFLRLAEIHHRVSRFLGAALDVDAAREAARVSETLSAEKNLTVRMTLRQSLTLLQRRVAHRSQMMQTLRACDLKMGAIEQSFAYLQSQVMALESARELKAEVEAFVTQFASVDGLEAEVGRALASAV